MSEENQPYPEGICWDEAWRQRQRADDMETGCESLSRLLRIGCKISEQDGEWWLFDEGGDGIISGKTLAEMIQRLRGVYVGDYEKRYDEKCRLYRERTRNSATCFKIFPERLLQHVRAYDTIHTSDTSRVWSASTGFEPMKEKIMSESTTFSGNNYSVELTAEGQFVLIHPVSENETFDNFDELVESHPVCEEARSSFFYDAVASTITKSQVDLNQGDDQNGRAFGYVAGEDGGFFFTWMPTLEETLESIDEDEQDGDGDLSESDVREFLRGYLPTTKRGQQMWSNE